MRVLLAAVLIPVAAMGQLSRTSETIDVNVVEIDVVVLDAQGNPVPGLRASDFDLRVGGHRRAITNFYPVNRRVDKSGAPATAASDAVARRDYLVLFIDDLHLNQHEKKRVLEALRTFVQQHVRLGTAAMLVVSDGNVRILEKFTEEPSRLIARIDALERQPAGANEQERERREVMQLIEDLRPKPGDRADNAEIALQNLERYVHHQQLLTESTIAALDRVTDAIKGLDGRRVMVYVSDGLPMQPGAEIYAWYKPEEFLGNTADPAKAALAQALPLDAQGVNLSTAFTRSARQAALAGVQFFAVDARGVQGFDEETPSSGRSDSTASTQLDSGLIRSNLQSSIQLLADETGGQAITDTNDMNFAFDKLDEHLSSYYSLGFISEGTGREDDINVNVKRRGLTVRASKHVRQRTAREEIADRVRGALYARVESNPLEARVTMVPISSGVKATIHVPTPKLSILPGSQSSFAVFVAMIDDQMRETPVRMFVHRIGPTEVEDSMQTLTLEAPPGSYTVSMAISDSYSLQVSYVQQDVTIPAKPSS